MSAIEDLKKLVDPATHPPLTDEDLQAALDASQIPDAADVWPGQPDYVVTYDLAWAAAEALTMRAWRAAQQPTEALNRVQSEGSSFEISTASPDWLAQARFWRARSRIGRETGYGETLGLVEVATPGSGFVPTSKGLSWT